MNHSSAHCNLYRYKYKYITNTNTNTTYHKYTNTTIVCIKLLSLQRTVVEETVKSVWQLRLAADRNVLRATLYIICIISISSLYIIAISFVASSSLSFCFLSDTFHVSIKCKSNNILMEFDR